MHLLPVDPPLTTEVLVPLLYRAARSATAVSSCSVQRCTDSRPSSERALLSSNSFTRPSLKKIHWINMEFITTKRGGQKLCLEGHMYTKKRWKEK